MLDQNILLLITGGVALVVGIIAGKLIFAKNTRKQVEAAEEQSQKMIRDAQTHADNLKKEKLLEAKERFVQLKAEHDKEVLERNRRMGESESRIKQKEDSSTRRWSNWKNR